jgi:hypothetical protein
MTRCIEQIEPQFNRIVVFDSVGTHHGHPDPITPPPGVARRSLALYYYVSPLHPSALPAADVPPLTFLTRPGEVFPPSERAREPRGSRLREVARDLLPPVMTRLIQRTRQRGRYRG